MKPLSFLGGALDDLRRFPDVARRRAGFQLDRVQRGLDPDDWRPMSGIGLGVREIRIRDGVGAFRVIYAASFVDSAYVLHAFEKRRRRHPSSTWISQRSGIDRSTRDDVVMQSFSNIRDALEPAPEAAAAWRLRSDLMTAIRTVVDRWGLAPVQAAQRLAIDEAEIDDLLHGHIDAFTLDRLVATAHRAGITIRLEAVDAAA